MSDDIRPMQERARKRRTLHKSQLKVVFDTNALYVTPTGLGSASDLVRQDIADLVAEAKYPDLEVLWYLPEVVRHERQYQMQAEALKLRPAINKIERLLGHNLALTDKVLIDHVQTKIEEKEKHLCLQEIKLDHGKVDWDTLIRAQPIGFLLSIQVKERKVSETLLWQSHFFSSSRTRLRRRRYAGWSL